MISVTFKPKSVRLVRDKTVASRFVMEIAKEGQVIFKKEASKRGAGRVYKRYGRTHQASIGGAFPASDTGNLVKGTKVKANGMSAELGTNVHYAVYLANGTIFMAKRAMYKEALLRAVKTTHASLDGFIKFEGR